MIRKVKIEKMTEKIKITAVSYLNTKPFLYGLLNHPIAEQIDIQLDIPSVCAAKLTKGEVDLGLVPVAAIPDIRQAQIISDYCIGTVGAVKTVCIYSDVPIQQVKTLYLDYHSRTSVALTKILLQKYWKVNPYLLSSSAGYIDSIGDNTAGLVIGDRTIGLEKRFRYVYDLGLAWRDYTDGLPFVFAAWVSNSTLPDGFIPAFNAALQQGLAHIPELIYILPTEYFQFDLKEYFTKNISYALDAPKKVALSRFLSEVKEKTFTTA